jgi:hypothetical protein
VINISDHLVELDGNGIREMELILHARLTFPYGENFCPLYYQPNGGLNYQHTDFYSRQNVYNVYRLKNTLIS